MIRLLTDFGPDEQFVDMYEHVKADEGRGSVREIPATRGQHGRSSVTHIHLIYLINSVSIHELTLDLFPD